MGALRIQNPYSTSPVSSSSSSSTWRRNISTRAQWSPYTCKPMVLHSSLQDYTSLKPISVDHTSLTLQGNNHNIRGFEKLKEEARKMLNTAHNPTDMMKSMDTLQRLGIAYHFEEEIGAALDGIANKEEDYDDLFSTALRFRLLRQHGYNASPEVFYKFMDKDHKFKEALSKDTSGMLSLYEASHLGASGENIMSQAMEFATKNLQKSMQSLDPLLCKEVASVLQLPRHMRMVRLDARSYIEEFHEHNSRSTTLLELAKLDFNMVQSLHQREMVEILSWWRELGLVDKLGFARDRPLECFLWTMGIFPEPSFSKCRIELTKAIAILLVIDDIYDTYGSLDELVLFTNAIQIWDLGAIDQLPEYMKICYMALYNTINEIGYKVLREHGWCIFPHLRRTWVDMCDAFLVEAKWFNDGIVPNLEDYLTNGVTTGGTYMALVHTFFLTGEKITKEGVEFMNPYPKLFSCSGRILRLWDDLGTSKDEQERGDVASSIECHMRESGVSTEDDARKHIRSLIHSLWKEVNGELISQTPLPLSIINASLNLSRTSQAIYQHGDDDKVSGVDDHIQSILVKPIPINGF